VGDLTNNQAKRSRRLTPGVTPEDLRCSSLCSGDVVRLKFLYPNAGIEVLDCIWVSLANLGTDGENPQFNWVVVRAGRNLLWKPLAYLVQIEILALNEGARGEARGLGSRDLDLAYHS
jgi:hypothetical protein